MCRGWRSPARAGVSCAAAASGPGARPAPKKSTAFPHPSWAEPCRMQLTPEPAEGHPPGAALLARSVVTNLDFGRRGMPRSVRALGPGFRHCPNSASLCRWDAGLAALAPCGAAVGAYGGSGARKHAQQRVTGSLSTAGTRTVPSSTRPCFGFAPTSGAAEAPGLRTARLGPGSIFGIWDSEAPVRAAELCQGSGKQPCTPTCRGGIAAALRPLTQPPVCRSCSRPRKPQAKSPHPCAGAFPAGSTGIAAFPQPGAGSEPLGVRGETVEKPQVSLFQTGFF